MVSALVIFSIAIVLMITLVILQNTVRAVANVRFPLFLIPLIIGAILFLALGIAPLNIVKDSFISNSEVNPLKILVLFLSMSFLSIYLDEMGFFSYLANWAVSKFKKGQIGLFIGLYVIVSLLTIFTSNDIVILTFTPFICAFARRAKISPIPYLVMEFIAANSFSMLFIIGNPTNIYIATFANIGFLDYLKGSWLPTILAGIGSFATLFLLFYKDLKKPMEVTVEPLKIRRKTSLIVSLSTLLVCVVFMAISSYVHTEMYLISLGCFLFLLVFELIHMLYDKNIHIRLGRAFLRVPYQVIPLLISMFIMVIGLNASGLSGKVAEFLSRGNPVLMYGVFSSIFDNIMNNIPMSVFFADIAVLSPNVVQATFASIIGSNLGAFITPIGALAGIMFLGLIKKEGIKFSFLDFCKYGVVVFLITLPCALLGLFLVTL